MNSTNNINTRLRERFETQRVVIWHDPDGEYTDELETLDLSDVTVERVNNNEFTLKHQILRVDPTSKFLLYRTGEIPTGTSNWLFDLELAFGVFTADRIALIQQDLGLAEPGIEQVIEAHDSFFRSKARLESLKSLINSDDKARGLRAKMCAVLLGQHDYNLSELTRTLLVENADQGDDQYQNLVKHNLDHFYWAEVANTYSYNAEHPSVDDFVLWMFHQAANRFVTDLPSGLRNIQLDFASFRNDPHSNQALAKLARRAADQMDYASTIEDTEISDLIDLDVFEAIDQKIVSHLAHAIVHRTVRHDEVAEIVRVRQSSRWIDQYRQLYTALRTASELLQMLGNLTLRISSFDDGLDRYQQSWFKVDQLYRQYHFAAQTASHSGLFDELRAVVEKFYSNRFLYDLGQAWQTQVDRVEKWRSKTLRNQTQFFKYYVDSVIKNGNRKLVVIISDALRYEIADELGSRIRQENRFEASLDAVLGVLPSYTQLGMAALLPHQTLAHSSDGDPVLVDGQRSDGTANRDKILKSVNGCAIRADAVFSMTRAELRELYKEHQVLYVYHDRIDAIGDDAATEARVFEATEAAIVDLDKLIKRLASANATNVLVTADHGFLYQHTPLADSFYLSTKPEGDELVVTNRRYVLGRGLKEHQSFVKFEPQQLGLSSDLEVQIPKSIHRLRLPGAGSRFVHGGASLQEIVVPVLKVNVQRTDTVRQVNVEVLPETDKITTGQLVVRLFQTDPVSDKVQERTLRAGLYVDDVLISNLVELVFNQTSTELRERYQNAQMLLGPKADEFNNRLVEFRLEERIPRTNQWRVYQKASYQLRRSFTTDFDF